MESVGAAVSDPKSEAAATAIKQGDVGKALLTSIFGESKADRAKLPLQESTADAELWRPTFVGRER